MKRLRSVETDKVQLEVGECDCGYHFGVDATYLTGVIDSDFTFNCPNCGAEIDTSKLFPEDPKPKQKMLIREHKPDALEIRMDGVNEALSEYQKALDDGPHDATEEMMIFETFYCKIEKIFDEKIMELAVGNLRAQHRAALINKQLREALGEILPIIEDEYAHDPEPEDIPSWKRAIDKGNEALKTPAIHDPDPKHFRVVFDGPPGPEGPRFVEVEDLTGVSIRKGRWVEDVDFWYLVFDDREDEEGDECTECPHGGPDNCKGCMD